jgi:hypothetical protein
MVKCKNISKLKTKEHFSLHFISQLKLSFLIFLSFSSTLIYSQQEIRTKRFSIQAGVNGGIGYNVKGPSLSFHYAYRTDRILQLESMLFFDYQTFSSRYPVEMLGLGLVTGIRINVSPKKDWNPSFVLMPGVIYSSIKTSREDLPYKNGFSGAVSIGFSNNFYKKNMITTGVNVGENILAIHLKYGRWF